MLASEHLIVRHQSKSRVKDRLDIPNTQSFIEEFKAKQENTVWPGPLQNAKSVDEFLWKGSPDAPLVPRIGAWIFGLFFIFVGVASIDIASEKHSLLTAVISIAWFLIGFKVFLNGFQKRRAKDLELK